MLLVEGIYWFNTIFLTKLVGALIHFSLGPVITIQGIKIRPGFFFRFSNISFNLEGVATIMENTVQNNGMYYIIYVFKSL